MPPPRLEISRSSGFWQTPVSYTHLDVYKRQVLQSQVGTGAQKEAEEEIEQKVAALTGVGGEQTCTVHVADTENQLMSTELTVMLYL